MAATDDGGSDTAADDGRCKCAMKKEDHQSTCLQCHRQSLNSSLLSSSLSCYFLSFDSHPVQYYDKLRRVYRASVKAFSIGAGLKGGLALFSFLSRLRRGRSLPFSKYANFEMASITEDVVLALKETLRYGLFLGAFAGTFVSVDETIAAFGGHHRHDLYPSLDCQMEVFAGRSIAGPSMLLTGLNTQHTSSAISILMRASVLASRCGIKSERFGKICKPLAWAHGDIFHMCLSSSQILSAYLLKQDSLPPSYKSFLNKHGAKDSVILQRLDPQMEIPCSIIHGNQACGTHFLSFLLQAYKRAFPVYLIPALIVHRQGLKHMKLHVLSIIRIYSSSLAVTCNPQLLLNCTHLNFLDAAVSTFRSFISLFKLIQASYDPMERFSWYCNAELVSLDVWFICTFPTGLALAIGKKSRRIEISLHCLSRAIESFFTCTADLGYLPQSKNLEES
ncbi:Hypothetical predicted protein [Olea europaea subsp. europaea]|uniref:Uncharacterized protein n=1 Tax=Olea europaea subsp. europaea TaxID=158383 RepID=A0A8S0PQT7_OLEEU|nr:Hypothetical predicted protein [Olea europaea subsp. europaea]